MSNPAHPRYSDLPKPDNAEGVGEWARRIRDFQRQIDDDEEAEHKRLQEEIAASRIARKRRSKGVVSPTSADFARSEESLPGVSDLKSIADRQQSQAEAFRKLNGPSNSPSPSKSEVTNSIASARAWMTSASTSATSPRSSGPMSLAAFMGGRATGPVLNKHAPQQDVHDPTQFEDRTRITAPHPVFGRGGVAMPGLAASNRFTGKDGNGKSSPVVSPKYANGGISLSSTPPLVIRERSSSPTKIVDDRPVSPQKTGGRGRTTSTPSESSGPTSPQKTGIRERTVSSPSPALSPVRSYAHAKEKPMSPQPTETRERTLSTPATELEASMKSRPVSATFSPPKTPTQPRSSPSQKSPVITPSLAKPIRPEPKPSPQAPHISFSQNTSPAFLKPPGQKEPTPSLSRLQGRGFVQNMTGLRRARARLQFWIGGSLKGLGIYHRHLLPL
ncbi:hypothetical protein GYMLUDRAFT_862508 [Collybiopsis luxurians FD-317 M1]|nr:hypothetical protein GYMLUDRAFT_862508 [Collybiopsis luxurians FD-317 M1]